MKILETVSKLSPQERDEYIKEFIGQNSNGILKREYFFKKRFAYVPYYLRFVYMLEEYGVKYYIKGSSAWFANARENIMKGYTGNIKTSSADSILDFLKKKFHTSIPLLASFLPQNWDICIYTDQVEIARKEIYKFMTKLSVQMKQDPLIIPQKRQTRRGGSSDTINIKVNTKGEGADTFKGAWVSMCSEEYERVHKFRDFDDKLVCTDKSKDTGIIGFLIFWVVIYNIPTKHMKSFEENFLDKVTIKLPSDFSEKSQVRFLNTLGLILNTTYMESSGISRKTEKKLDIDKLRSESLELNRYESFQKLQHIWFQTFGSWSETEILSLFYEGQFSSITNNIKKNILSNYIVNSGINYMQLLENNLLSDYRAVINNIIIHINYILLSKTFDGVESVKLFIVGGDAFARYIPTTNLSDIDIKLIITPNVKTRGKNPIMPSELKQDVVKFIVEILSEYIVFLNYTGKFFDRPLFRVRNYDATKQNVPYNLISLDCRGNHDVPEANVSGFYLDYAILDISIMWNNTKKNTDDYITEMDCIGELKLPGYLTTDENIPESKQLYQTLDNLIQSAKIPIASSNFLLSEMVERYNNPNSVEARYFNGKIEKDIERYIILKNYQNQPIQTINVMDPFLFWTMNEEKLKRNLQYFGCVYSSEFDFIRTYKKGKKLQIVAPDRFSVEKSNYINIKSKTSFSSDKFVFCDEEYHKQMDMTDIKYFMANCHINFDGNYSDENIKKNVYIFCEILNRNNRTEYKKYLGNITPLKTIIEYLNNK